MALVTSTDAFNSIHMLGERGFIKLLNRKSKVASYNFDLTLIGDYWGWFDKRFYHHTGMVSTW